jgi:hypothetical protein
MCIFHVHLSFLITHVFVVVVVVGYYFGVVFVIEALMLGVSLSYYSKEKVIRM